MPRTIKRKVYNLAELNIPARRRAHEEFLERSAGWDIPWADETFQSLKAVIEAAGLTLKNWDLGAYNRGNSIHITGWAHDEVKELSGARAQAWLENNLFGPLRVKAQAGAWKIDNNDKTSARCYWYKGTMDRPARRDGHVGEIPSCPLTGYCADDDYLDALCKDVRGGMTLEDAFNGLADEYARIVEGEAEYMRTWEYFRDYAMGNDEEFTYRGERV